MQKQIAALRFPLYDLVSRLPGPRHIAHKILLVALLGCLTPLFLLSLYLLIFTSPGDMATAPLLVLLAGTVLGAVITLVAIKTLLTPINAIGQALTAFDKARDLPPFGRQFEGEIGELMNNTQYALTSLRHSIEHLDACAQIDMLTKLLNRDGAANRLNRMVLTDAEKPRDLLLLLIDLEGFGKLNDRYGRAIGDRVLQRVGDLLRAGLRERDWVARWGDDQFLLVLANNARQDIAGVSARLRDQLKALKVDDAGSLVLDVEFCAGAAYLQPGMSVDELLETADHARRQAKQNADIHCFVAGEVNA